MWRRYLSGSQGQGESSGITCSSSVNHRVGPGSGFQDTPNFVPFPFSSLIASLKRLFPLFRNSHSNSFLRPMLHKHRAATKGGSPASQVSSWFLQEQCRGTIPIRRNPTQLSFFPLNSPVNTGTRSYFKMCIMDPAESQKYPGWGR